MKYSSLSTLVNGSGCMPLTNNHKLCYQISNVKLLKKSDYLLIVFSGAISERQNKVAPFFSGNKLSNLAQVPLISLSDPIVDESKDVGLAWYAGSIDIPNLQVEISDLLEFISKVHKKELLLVGGSGGAFASLAISSLLNVKCIVLCWNPQFEISKYDPFFFRKYYVEAFKTEFTKHGNYFEKLNIIHKIDSSMFLDKNHNICILQNDSDWHKSIHLPIFLNEHCKWDRKNRNLFSRKNCSGDIGVYINNWGNGHAQINIDVIVFIIKNLMKGDSFNIALTRLNNHRLMGEAHNYVYFLDKKNPKEI